MFVFRVLKVLIFCHEFRIVLDSPNRFTALYNKILLSIEMNIKIYKLVAKLINLYFTGPIIEYTYIVTYTLYKTVYE